MVTNIPLYIRESAESDINYMLDIVNVDEDLDAELLTMRIELEDAENDRYDVSIFSTISFGYDPRQHLEFDWDYFVDGDTIKFWGHGDINMLANELKQQILSSRRL